MRKKIEPPSPVEKEPKKEVRGKRGATRKYFSHHYNFILFLAGFLLYCRGSDEPPSKRREYDRDEYGKIYGVSPPATPITTPKDDDILEGYFANVVSLKSNHLLVERRGALSRSLISLIAWRARSEIPSYTTNSSNASICTVKKSLAVWSSCFWWRIYWAGKTSAQYSYVC